MRNPIVLKKWFVRDLMPVAEIAKRLECSRQYVYILLRQLGVDTRKKPFVDTVCSECGKPIKRRRFQVRVEDSRFFCNKTCFLKNLHKKS